MHVAFVPLACPAISPQSLEAVLEGAKYAIKTGCGIYKDTYCHSDKSQIFGSGQDTVDSGIGWAKIVSAALYICDKIWKGSFYADPQDFLEATIGMLNYINDNNLADKKKRRRDSQQRTQTNPTRCSTLE